LEKIIFLLQFLRLRRRLLLLCCVVFVMNRSVQRFSVSNFLLLSLSLSVERRGEEREATTRKQLKQMVVKIGGGGGGGTALTVFYLLQYRMGGDQSEGGAIK